MRLQWGAMRKGWGEHSRMVRVEAVSLVGKPLQCVIWVRDKDGFTPSNLLLDSVSNQQHLLFFLFFI